MSRMSVKKIHNPTIPKLECSYSTISPDELMAKVIPLYNIDKPLECRFWQANANDTYQIHCAEAYYFLRVYRHNAYPFEANEFEAEALNYLHQKDFPVANPIEKKSGGFITEILAPEGPRFILLTTLAKGEPPNYESLDTCRLVGHSVARMHQISSGFKTLRKRTHLDLQWLLEDSLTVIRNHTTHFPEKLNSIEAMVKDIRIVVESIPDESLDIGICHGDLHGGNMHIHEGKITHFDFEECAIGYRVYDLATFKWGACRGSGGAERWSAFLEGYTSVRSISDANHYLVDPFVFIRELAETAYGIRNVKDFGYNDIMASDINNVCDQLEKYAKIVSC